jgi:hypothetical protein
MPARPQIDRTLSTIQSTSGFSRVSLRCRLEARACIHEAGTLLTSGPPFPIRADSLPYSTAILHMLTQSCPHLCPTSRSSQPRVDLNQLVIPFVLRLLELQGIGERVLGTRNGGDQYRKHAQANEVVTDLQLPYRFILYISHFIYDAKILYNPDPSNIFLRNYFIKQFPPLRTSPSPLRNHLH